MRLLNNTYRNSISVDVRELMDELGYTPEEAIPGLIDAVGRLAELTEAPEQALDEAGNQLADGVGND